VTPRVDTGKNAAPSTTPNPTLAPKDARPSKKALVIAVSKSPSAKLPNGIATSDVDATAAAVVGLVAEDAVLPLFPSAS
jgi:hypothetical protein